MGLGNVFILGDSYSTFEGFIPEGYEVYYSGEKRKNNDVNCVRQTWWHQLLEKNDARLLRNSSFSGSTICNTGYDGNDYSDRSFITRIDRLIAEGFFETNKVDTLFVFGGTNDSWSDAPVGELKYSDWTEKELYSALPAVGYLFHRISENIPDVKVICIINTELKEVIHNGLKVACERYNIDVIELEDIDKQDGHPSVAGMHQIYEQIQRKLSVL